MCTDHAVYIPVCTCMNHAAYIPVCITVSVCLYMCWRKHAFILASLIQIQNHRSISPPLGFFVIAFWDGRNLGLVVRHLHTFLFNPTVHIRRFRIANPHPCEKQMDQLESFVSIQLFFL